MRKQEGAEIETQTECCGCHYSKPHFICGIRPAMYLILMQVILLGIKQIVFVYMPETPYSRSVLTMIYMIVLFAVMLLLCQRKSLALSAFPTRFGPIYIVVTILSAIFYAVTLFFANTFSVWNAMMLFYGSIVTPVFEELLFRGAVWNKLNLHFSKEWQTYLIVTALFGLWHIGYAVGIYLWSGGSLLNCIVIKVAVGAVFGVITGAVRLKTRNCYLGILVHGVLNIFG